MEKRVLILSEAFGSGHTTVANALMQGIQHIDPSIQVRVLEVMKDFRPASSKMLNFCYLSLIKISPSLWGRFYAKRRYKPYPRWHSYFLYLTLYHEMKQIFQDYDPHVIVCTHPFTNAVSGIFKRYGYHFTLCSLVTDLHFHGAWVCPETDHYFVTCKDMDLPIADIESIINRINVTGIPTRRGFWEKEDQRAVRKELNIRNMPTVLVMGGGLGLGGIEKVAESLYHLKESLQIVICTGNNITLKRQLEENKKYQHPNIMILGYVDIIDKWMDASDLLITKAGGSTCYEAISKSLPIVIYQPITGQEEMNCDFLKKYSLGTHIQDLDELPNIVDEILNTPQMNEKILKNIRHFQENMDPLASAKSIVNLLNIN